MKLHTYLLIFATAIVAPLWSGQGDRIKGLVPGKPVSGIIEVTADRPDFVTYRFSVPKSTVALRITLSDSPADLDLFLKHGSEITDYDSVDTSVASDDYNETIFLTRFTDPPLKDGTYYLDIAYQRPAFPISGRKKLDFIPFTLSVDLVPARIEAVLAPGKPVRSVLEPDQGMITTFVVDVPLSAQALRIDLYNLYGDADLFIRYRELLIHPQDADVVSETPLGRETVVLTKQGPDQLRPGTYYITVVDQSCFERREEFSIIASFREDPPESLTKLPVLPIYKDPLERCLHATVEVIGEAGKGSGCIVSPDGLILTNWHVIRGFSGKVSETIYVAYTMDPAFPPEELYKAMLLEFDEQKDIALLKISKGLYNQNLQIGTVFPILVCGDSEKLRIGDSLGFLGYPSIGGRGSRVSISYTKGIVSGFDQTSLGKIIKTDGVITSGNSGGAALNEAFELIGIPTSVIGDDAGQMGYVHPLSMIPDSWLRLIREHAGN